MKQVISVFAYKDNYTEPAGHAWDGGAVTQEPTAEAEGELTYPCGVCGETRTEPKERNPYRYSLSQLWR